MTTQLMTNNAPPVQDAARAADCGRCAIGVAVIPISAPSASSHARVNVEKYAGAGARAVETADQASETAPTTQTVVAIRRRQCAADPRRVKRAATRNSA